MCTGAYRYGNWRSYSSTAGVRSFAVVVLWESCWESSHHLLDQCNHKQFVSLIQVIQAMDCVLVPAIGNDQLNLMGDWEKEKKKQVIDAVDEFIRKKLVAFVRCSSTCDELFGNLVCTKENILRGEGYGVQDAFNSTGDKGVLLCANHPFIADHILKCIQQQNNPKRAAAICSCNYFFEKDYAEIFLVQCRFVSSLSDVIWSNLGFESVKCILSVVKIKVYEPE